MKKHSKPYAYIYITADNEGFVDPVYEPASHDFLIETAIFLCENLINKYHCGKVTFEIAII